MQIGIVYWIKLFLLMSIFCIAGCLLAWFLQGIWSLAFFTCLEFGSLILSGLYVYENRNNPLGGADLW